MMYVQSHSPQQSTFGQQQSFQSTRGISHGFPVATSFVPTTSMGIQPTATPGTVQTLTDPTRTAVTYGFSPSGWSGAQQSGGQMMQPGMTGGWSSSVISSSGMTQPRVDIAETNSDVVVTAELPNINSESLYVTVTDDSLSISCNSLASGIPTSIHRTVALPTSVRSERVETSYSNGVLETRLPKSDASNRRRIQVSQSST